MQASALVAVLLFALAAGAQPYLSARGGAQAWPDHSNGDELEASADPGGLGALAVGYGVGERVGLDVELEGALRLEPLHGRNTGDVEHSTADGEWLTIVQPSLGLWPRVRLAERVSVYAGGSIGPAWLKGLGDDELALGGQVGAGVRVDLVGDLAAELGYRGAWLADVQIDGYRAGYDAHGVALGLRWELR